MPTKQKTNSASTQSQSKKTGQWLVLGVVALGLVWWLTTSFGDKSPAIPFINNGVEQLVSSDQYALLRQADQQIFAANLATGREKSLLPAGMVVVSSKSDSNNFSSPWLIVDQDSNLRLYNVSNQQVIDLGLEVSPDQNVYAQQSFTNDDFWLEINTMEVVDDDEYSLYGYRVLRRERYLITPNDSKQKMVLLEAKNGPDPLEISCDVFDGKNQKKYAFFCEDGFGTGLPIVSRDLFTGEEEVIMVEEYEYDPDDRPMIWHSIHFSQGKFFVSQMDDWGSLQKVEIFDPLTRQIKAIDFWYFPDDEEDFFAYSLIDDDKNQQLIAGGAKKIVIYPYGEEKVASRRRTIEIDEGLDLYANFVYLLDNKLYYLAYDEGLIGGGLYNSGGNTYLKEIDLQSPAKIPKSYPLTELSFVESGLSFLEAEVGVYRVEF
ncbi:hypothetical protein FWH30_00890 [Microgenomates group bacterium]|nr:hypothetical protein [Microgenomates group bacterium]